MFFLIHIYTHKKHDNQTPFMKNPKTKIWQQKLQEMSNS